METLLKKWEKLYKKYRKHASMVAISFTVLFAFYVYTQSDFYFFIQLQILKQQEKLDNDNVDIKYYDIVSYNTFCHMQSFRLYMKWQPLDNRLRINRICKELDIRYNNLPPIIIRYPQKKNNNDR